MNHYFHQPASTSQSARPEECPPLPPCPECGGLECLCRPRFFAGQLLTEEDLNRLQRYIIEKNKLHNRYLHGWGVVCGLEVVCSPCHNMVHVKPGYALSPCGEDIIVCKDDTVDVCALIQACRPVRPQECDQPQLSTGENCREVTEDWVLAICYDEKSSHGTTALRGSSGAVCCSRCNCGGSSACGCSCHNQAYSSTNSGKKNGNGYRPAQPNPPPQCEPTLICEGYFYRVYKAPKRKEGDRRDPGALVTRFLACLNELTQQIATYPSADPTPEKLFAWCCSFKETLRDLLVTQGIYDCLIADRLATVSCPDPNNPNFDSEWLNTLQQLLIILWEFFKYCFCSALLPPCPEPVTDDCVPLATVTVRGRDCRIVQVCNWGPRKFAITLPNLGYWLSILTPFAQFIREAIERICCRPLQFRGATVNAFASRRSAPGVTPNVSPSSPTNTSSATGTAGTSAKMTPEREFTTLLFQSLLNPERGFDAQALLVLNVLGATDARGNPALSQLERDNPLQFLLFNQIIAPLIESSKPERSASVSGAVERMGAPPEAAPASASEVAALRETVEKLQSLVESQQVKIDKLSRRP